MVNFHQMVVSFTMLLLVQASTCMQLQHIIIMNMHVSLASTHIPAFSPMKTIWAFQFNVLFPTDLLPALPNLPPLLWKAFSHSFADNKTAFCCEDIWNSWKCLCLCVCVCMSSLWPWGNCKVWLALPSLGTFWGFSHSPLWSVKTMKSQSQFLNLESHL